MKEMEALGMFDYIKPKDDFWPAIDDFDPGITTDEYLDVYFADPGIAKPSYMKALSELAFMGETTTYRATAQKYGEEPQYYYNLVSRVDEAISKASGIQNYQGKYWSIVFQVQDPGASQLVFRMRPELRSAVEQLVKNGRIPVPGGVKMKTSVDINTILYGPPGTGKTYNTVRYAVSICDGIELAQLPAYSEVLKRYHELEGEGRIEFTTFHQSYGYEEFIEGISPVVEDGADIAYQYKDGIFKTFCKSATRGTMKENSRFRQLLNDAPKVWKVSLEGTGDNETRKECLKNGHIRIGWDEYGEDYTKTKNYEHGGEGILKCFYQDMRVGDIVLSCYSQYTIDAIGIITGEPEWATDYNYYERLRKVEWVYKGAELDVKELNHGIKLTRSTVYRLKIDPDDIESIIPENAQTVEHLPHVFIIDEINRGNISKIFGELITLIEPSKRAGAEEARYAILPYTGEPFSVPENVYILGTMNTADRSIALMDTALRRRFQFVEMMPQPDVLAGVVIDGVRIDAMLDVLNQRIEYLYDREHMIGHAYFMELKKTGRQNLTVLADIFEKSVIPLLQEYFYEDYHKIQLVLGDNAKTGENKQYRFIEEVPATADLFEGDDEEISMMTVKRYRINKKAFNDIRSYQLISRSLNEN